MNKLEKLSKAVDEMVITDGVTDPVGYIVGSNIRTMRTLIKIINVQDGLIQGIVENHGLNWEEKEAIRIAKQVKLLVRELEI